MQRRKRISKKPLMNEPVPFPAAGIKGKLVKSPFTTKATKNKKNNKPTKSGFKILPTLFTMLFWL